MTVRKNEAGQYVLKSGDVEKEYSEEELFQLAQKGFGAEMKFESASQMVKEADSKLQEATNRFRSETGGILKRANQGDPAAYSQLLDLMGVEGDQKTQQLQSFMDLKQQAETLVAEEPRGGKRNMEAAELPSDVQAAGGLVNKLQAKGFTDDEIADLMAENRSFHQERTRTRVYQDLDTQLEKDPVLSKIISRGGTKANHLRNLAQEKLKGRIRDEQKYDPQMRDSVVKDLRTLAEELGIGSEATSIPGLAEAPGLSHFDAQATEPPKPTDKVLDGDYSTNVTQRLAYLMRAE